MDQNKKLSLHLFFCLCLIILTACGDSRPQRNFNSPQPVQQQANREANTNAVKPIVWPPSSEGIQTVDASHMLDKNYYLLLDTSGSMKGDRLETAKNAIQQFVQSVPQNANLGFGMLGSQVREIVPLATNNREMIINEMMKLNANGGTPLGAAIRDIGLEKLSEQAARQLGYGEYTLVVITDGEAGDEQLMVNVVDALLQNTSIILYTIGFHIDEHHSLNQSGRTIYRTANDLQSLTQALGDVLAESPSFDISDFK
jgi:uncharacterized protein YegL